MLAGIDTTRLRVFREVVERGSFTAAAAALNISQPAVSQHVAKLEQETGCPLLERSSRRLRLTQAGEVYLSHIQNLLAGLDEAYRELAALAGADTGQLRVASFPSAAATVVPPVIGAFRRSMPKVRIGLHEADPPVSLPKLMAGDFDLVLAYDYPILGVPRDPRLVWQVVALDAMAAAVPVGHPLAERDAVMLQDLAREAWAAPHHTVCRDALELACRKAGFQPDVVAETNHYMAMLGMVASGVGVAVVPRLLAGGVLPGGVVLRRLDGTRLVRTVAVVRRAAGSRTPSMRKMSELLCEYLADHVQPDMSVRLPEQVA
jgi:DNA-binding transcriptional LysR family regulator